jgi:hypothetical protein
MESHPSLRSRIFTGAGLLVILAICSVNEAISQVSESYSGRFGEYRIEIRDIIPESRVVINIPEQRELKRERETRIIIYALPNGNTIEQTEGLLPFADTKDKEGVWRFDIQHIAAQTRFLRERDKRFNYIVVYLESDMLAWTSHAAKYKNSYSLYPLLIDSVRLFISQRLPETATPERQRITLASHSGGGRFCFNYISGVESIPGFIERFAFIDSNYGYETDMHADKLLQWLIGSNEGSYRGRYLGLLAYVDTTVILNGKPIVSKTGGTGYRGNLLAKDLMERSLPMTLTRDTSFVKYSSKGLDIIIKENPQGSIYHTLLVEKNGLIHMMLAGSSKEDRGYKFWGERSYSHLIDIANKQRDNDTDEMLNF